MKRVGVLTNSQSRRDSFKGLGVEALYLFGSRARGEATDLSDVDLFFDYEKGRLGVYELMEVTSYAASVLGEKTDIVTRDSLRGALRHEIEETAVRVFL